MSYQPFPSFEDWSYDFYPALVDQYARRLQQTKESATPEAQKRALEVATRYAAIDTGALEGLYSTDRGFTKTIATQSEFWQQALALKGEQVKRSIEDALAGYDFILDAATQLVPITQVWIRELHATITKHQETYKVYVSLVDQTHTQQHSLPHGEYKEFPNNPTSTTTGKIHDYASPENTSAEMARLVDELASAEFLAAHPVVQAAYAHYAYICIHPFADGNGRVARALASVYLYRNPGVPLVIFADQRDVYIDALEDADEGNPSIFIQFIAERVIDTIGLVEQTMRVSDNAAQQALQQISETSKNEPPQELMLASSRLREVAASVLRDKLDELNLPPWVEAVISYGHSNPEVLPKGYILGSLDSSILLSGRKTPRTNDLLGLFFSIGVSKGKGLPELIIVQENEDISLEVWLREISPVFSTALSLKLDTWAEGVVNRFVCALADLGDMPA